MSAHVAKGTVGVVLTVFGWALVYVLVAHSWALMTARESVVGPMGLLAFEVLGIVPTLAYLFAAGLLFGSLFGPAEGARWVALGAAIAMALEALIEHQIFFGGIDPLAVAILSVDYLLPIVFAVTGALITRFWRRPNANAVAT